MEGKKPKISVAGMIILIFIVMILTSVVTILIYDKVVKDSIKVLIVNNGNNVIDT